MSATLTIEHTFVLCGGEATSSQIIPTLPLSPFHLEQWDLFFEQPPGELSPHGFSTFKWGFRRLSPSLSPGAPPKDATLHFVYNTQTLQTEQLDLTSTSEFELQVYGCTAGTSCSARLCMPLDNSLNTAALERTATAIASLRHSRHPNDTLLSLPRERRNLWVCSTILKSASPYFASLLQSSFLEGALSSMAPNYDGLGSTELDFDDSDDDEALAPPATDSTEAQSTCNHSFHLVKITQATYKTYEAVYSWIMTGYISFALLASTSKAREVEGVVDPTPADGSIVDDSTSMLENSLPLPSTTTPPLPPLPPTLAGSPQPPPRASPKSIYRLAHLLDLPQLQQLALNNINSQLTPTSVAFELFSDVAASYEAFRTLVVDYAVEHWVEVKGSAAWKKMQQRVAQGELMHSVSMFMELSMKLK